MSKGKQPRRNFMTSLYVVRASQADSSSGGLTEQEIYGNMFTFNFAGLNSTTHTTTSALFFLAANPGVQGWLSEEIRHVMGDRPPNQWKSSDAARLKRCLAVMYVTLRLYSPIPTCKFVDGQVP